MAGFSSGNHVSQWFDSVLECQPQECNRVTMRRKHACAPLAICGRGSLRGTQTCVSGQQKYSASCARRLAMPPRPPGPSGALACAIAASSACLRAKAASADRPGCGCSRHEYQSIWAMDEVSLGFMLR